MRTATNGTTAWRKSAQKQTVWTKLCTTRSPTINAVRISQAVGNAMRIPNTSSWLPQSRRRARAEPNKTPLFVGAVVVKDGKIIARGHRGQHKLGEHAEYTTLERNLPNPGAAANATLYCTLEPCIVRNHPKSPCAEWIKRHRIARVVIGVIDPNRTIRGGGVKLLREAGIDVALFPKPFATEIEAMNSAFEREHALESGVQPSEAATRPSKSTKRRTIVLVTFAVAVLAAIGTVLYFVRNSRDRERRNRGVVNTETAAS